jgi:hypothetical protein
MQARMCKQERKSRESRHNIDIYSLDLVQPGRPDSSAPSPLMIPSAGLRHDRDRGVPSALAVTISRPFDFFKVAAGHWKVILGQERSD